MSALPRRVVVTGLGVISPIGLELETFWNALVAGKSGVQPLEEWPEEAMPFRYAGAVKDFTGHIKDFGPLEKELQKPIRKGLRLMCRETEMGVAAAQRALSDAGLTTGSFEPERIGVSFGTGYMLTMPDDFRDAIKKCMQADGRFHFEQWGDEGLGNVNPLWLLKYLPNMPACHIAIYNDLRGPSNSLTQGEAAGNLAIGEAAQIIARGSAEQMVCGATGTRLHLLRTLHTVLQEEIAISDEAPETVSRPFDRNRSGMVLGEGAASLILESYESAQQRGAKIYAEILGSGSSCVVGKNHLPKRGQAMANAMAAALRSAGVDPQQIHHINAHGLSTRSCDAEESNAIHQVFNGEGAKIPTVAPKSHFGNLGAGAGTVELVASILAVNHGHLFPVLNYQTPDPDCQLSAVRDSGAEAGELFLKVSVSHNSQASCVVFRKFE